MDKTMKYLYTKKLVHLPDWWSMAQINGRRALVEGVAQKAVEDALGRGKRVQTIDPVLRTAKRLYPFYPERELFEIASAALRLILSPPPSDTRQMTLLTSS